MIPAPPVLVEACVDSPLSARQAVAGGAGRLELCSGLVEGGVTPSAGLMSVVRSLAGVPVHVLIRPRGGDFLYDRQEIETMLLDIAEAKRLSVAGVVLGALDPEGRIDAAVTARLVSAARPMAVVFHRAFDLARDPVEALEALISLGIERVLTSGQAATAEAGTPVLRELVRRSRGRVAILAGGGITETSAAAIVRQTGVREIHLRGSAPAASAMRFRRDGVFMGKRFEPDEYLRTDTSSGRIQAVVAAVRAIPAPAAS